LDLETRRAAIIVLRGLARDQQTTHGPQGQASADSVAGYEEQRGTAGHGGSGANGQVILRRGQAHRKAGPSSPPHLPPLRARASSSPGSPFTQDGPVPGDAPNG